MGAKKAQNHFARALFTLWQQRMPGARTRVLPARPPAPLPAPPLVIRPARRTEPYSVCLAQTESERHAAFRLRFQVFNLEMREGLESSYHTGEDTDAFDPICDHLIVRHGPGEEVVGTYRMQTGPTAAANLGYYSAREFDFSPYERLRSVVVELGRACIHPDHRKYEVLVRLWKGIARYAMQRNASYLIGCSSISSQDPAIGSAMYEKLKPMLVPEELRTAPRAGHDFPLSGAHLEVSLPKLLRTYISVGARICGPPAIDPDFGTIDFLTLMDLNSLSPAVRSRFIDL
jgi:putative hemolysin